MTENYCQMRIIGDGIRCDQQPPQDDCCNHPAHEYIVIYGEKQWLCAPHYDEHIETRSSYVWMARVWTRTAIHFEQRLPLSPEDLLF